MADLQIFMVVPHNDVKKVLIVELHLIALEVVIFQLRLIQDLYTALAGEFEETFSGLSRRLVRDSLWHGLRRWPWVSLHRSNWLIVN